MGSVREEILERLRARPGVSTSEVATEFGLDPSTADYHLKRLMRDGDAVVEVVGRVACWFPGKGYCPVLRRAIPLMARVEAQRVAMALDDVPRSATAIARSTSLKVGAVRWTAAALEDAGLARRSSMGRLVLSPGAHVCVARAAARARCDEWGACPVSKAFEWRTLTSSRSPSATGAAPDRSSGPRRAPSSE